MSKSNKRNKFDWNSYTDYRSRKYRDDLMKFCANFRDSEIRRIFNNADETGLWPIHWAAIHNRPDLIDVMVTKGSPIRIKCSNKLFACGTPLHLASMNGSIEAAARLLHAEANSKNKHEPNQTKIKTIETNQQSTNKDEAAQEKETKLKWLDERDLDDQTPLMRSAAPRSKRLDTVRDLLRKNLWSVSGRPAEMALYLINKGASWSVQEKYDKFNLMHLAIINGYDDIVNLLINIEPEMAWSPLKLDTNETSGDISPLQLAIVCGRVNIIRLLWSQQANQSSKSNSSDLNTILSRVIWSNVCEFRRFIKRIVLKYSLALDLAIFGLVWLPAVVLSSGTIFAGLWGIVTLVSYVAVCALAFRVSSKDPGYLQRNSTEYFQAMKSLVPKSSNKSEDGTNQKDKKKKKESLVVEDSSSEAFEEVPLLDKQDASPGSNELGDKIEEQVRLLCHKCRSIRRRRSRHCDYCEHCIQDFDHHCLYLGACIGRDNRLDFLVMSLLMAWLGLYASIYQIVLFADYYKPKWYYLGLFWVLKYLVAGALTAFLTLRRACLGVTMYESIRSDRIRRIFGPNGPPKSVVSSNKLYSTAKGSFWRYSPDRFTSGDLPAWRIRRNLNEFASNVTLAEYWRRFEWARPLMTSWSKDKRPWSERREMYQRL